MAVTANQVQSLYLAYFGRPAEQAGLTYWTAQTNATVDQISAAFSQQPEYTATYGSLNRVQTIQSLYNHLFNRTASDTEINYWNASSDVSVDRMALALVNGATGNDSVTLSSKVSIAQALTVINGPSATAATLTAAGNAQNFNTVFTGSSSQSPSQQAAQSFSAAIQAVVNQTKLSIAAANVVDANGNTVASNANVLASLFSGTTATLNAVDATSPTVVLPSTSATTDFTVTGTVTGGTNANSPAAGTLTFQETLGTNETTQTLTTLHVNVANTTTAGSVAPSTVNVVATNITSLTTIDGSGSSANLTINETANSGANTALANLATLNGGSGNDVITVSTVAASAGQTVAALTVNGGAGADQITGITGSAALTINGGDGADTVTLTTTGATAASTVNLGAGNDVINLAAGAFGTGTSHAVSIDLGAGNDTLNLTTLSNLHASETAAQLTQDLVKVANFGTGDKLVVSALDSSTATYQALSSNGATSVASASNLLAAVTAALSDITQTGSGAVGHSTSFQYGGNTYIVHSDTTAGVTAGDGVIELTGFQGNFVATAGAAAGNFTAA